jgi:predicted AAA+ superfamily ATPase
MMDTGLLVSLAFRDRPYLENELYKAILLDRLQVNEGMILENMVAQCIRASGRRAFFYIERDAESRRTILEVDFVIRIGKKLVPVEVKSGASRQAKSLVRLKARYGSRIGESIVLHPGEIQNKEDIWYLPYYMAAAF